MFFSSKRLIKQAQRPGCFHSVPLALHTQAYCLSWLINMAKINWQMRRSQEEFIKLWVPRKTLLFVKPSPDKPTGKLNLLCMAVRIESVTAQPPTVSGMELTYVMTDTAVHSATTALKPSFTWKICLLLKSCSAFSTSYDGVCCELRPCIVQQFPK